MRLLITGASGQLGSWITAAPSPFAESVLWPGPRQGGPDLAALDALRQGLEAVRPQVILHTAAMARVSDCQRDPVLAQRINVEASALLASMAARVGARLVCVSTDMVFDGTAAPYQETARPTPRSTYGRTKAEAEAAVLAHPRHAVVRISLLFGPTRCGRPTFFDDQLRALRTATTMTLFEDEWRTPLDLATAAQALLAVAHSDFHGILHLGGPESITRYEMGRRLAAYMHADATCLKPVRRDVAPAPEPRPRDVSLDSSLWRSLFPTAPWPTYEEALRVMQVSA